MTTKMALVRWKMRRNWRTTTTKLRKRMNESEPEARSTRLRNVIMKFRKEKRRKRRYNRS